MGVIRDELIEIRDKFGDERKTDIVAAEGEIDEEDMIEEKQVAITMTHLGYVKRVAMDSYRTQKRGGKGITALTTRENDFVKDLIITSTHDYLMFFTNTGKAFKCKAYEIPEAKRTARGTPIVNFLNLMQHERISAVMPVKDFSPDTHLILITRKGIIKRTDMAQFNNSRKNGLIAIKLKEDDELIDIKQVTGTGSVIVVTKMGKSICFLEDDVRLMGRVAGGVRAIQLDEDDEVVAMELAEKNEQLLVVTSHGYGKRTPVKSYTLQKRGGKGLLTYAKGKFDKTGMLIGAMVVDDDDEVMLISSEGIIIRIKASDVSRLGRTTQGVKIMKVADDANIIAMAKVPKDTLADEETGDSADRSEQITLDV